MKSSSRRASRMLIASLIAACALGAAYQVYRSTRHPSADPAKNPSADMQAAGVTGEVNTDPLKSASADPLKTQTPAPPVSPKTNTLMAVAPATAPASLVFGPSTRPVAFAAPLQTSSTTQLLADAKLKMTSGELLSARTLLNDALLSDSLAAGDVEPTKNLIITLNQSLIFSPKCFSGDPYCLAYSVKPGDKLTRIAADHDITWELLCRLNKLDDPRKLRSGRTIKLIRGPFHAVVSKSAFRMDLYLGAPGEKGSLFVAAFPVGLGKDDSTPTGTWQVEPHKKIKNPTYFSPRGEGIIAADDPKNPLGEFWIGLTGVDGSALGKASYGIHGTIEPDSIGKMSSMGCIRMHNQDVQRVFEMLIEGKSKVVVKD